MTAPEQKLRRVAFIVDSFPAASETFIINQIADLKDRGIDVSVFAFERGNTKGVSQRFYDYGMEKLVSYLDFPTNKVKRAVMAVPKIFKIALTEPAVLIRAFDFKRFGRGIWSLKNIFRAGPFVGKNFDLYHCHYGKIANNFLDIKAVLGREVKMVTSFYGYDVSQVFREKGDSYYDRLRQECSAYIVMSNNMKERVVAHGFKPEQVTVLPVSIEVESYPFIERTLQAGEAVKMISVGRFVEKKGFDDLLRALAIVKQRTGQKFQCDIVGGGPLEAELKEMTADLGLTDMVDYKGYMKIEDVLELFLQKHLFIQPSKTAKDGDME